VLAFGVKASAASKLAAPDAMPSYVATAATADSAMAACLKFLVKERTDTDPFVTVDHFFLGHG
jgi:hypothetical protein